MPTVRIQEKNYSESIMVLKLKDGNRCDGETGNGKGHRRGLRPVAASAYKFVRIFLKRIL